MFLGLSNGVYLWESPFRGQIWIFHGHRQKVASRGPFLGAHKVENVGGGGQEKNMKYNKYNSFGMCPNLRTWEILRKRGNELGLGKIARPSCLRII